MEESLLSSGLAASAVRPELVKTPEGRRARCRVWRRTVHPAGKEIDVL